MCLPLFVETLLSLFLLLRNSRERNRKCLFPFCSIMIRFTCSIFLFNLVFGMMAGAFLQKPICVSTKVGPFAKPALPYRRQCFCLAFLKKFTAFHCRNDDIPAFISSQSSTSPSGITQFNITQCFGSALIHDVKCSISSAKCKTAAVTARFNCVTIPMRFKSGFIEICRICRRNPYPALKGQFSCCVSPSVTTTGK